jgi:type III secretion protein F
MTVGNIGQLFQNSVSQLSTKSDSLQTNMDTMMKSKDGLTQEDMLSLQFEMGQYTAMIESVSNVTKSLTDTLKSLAQKAG